MAVVVPKLSALGRDLLQVLIYHFFVLARVEF